MSSLACIYLSEPGKQALAWLLAVGCAFVQTRLRRQHDGILEATAAELMETDWNSGIPGGGHLGKQPPSQLARAGMAENETPASCCTPCLDNLTGVIPDYE